MKLPNSISGHRGLIALFDISVVALSLPLAAWLRGNFDMPTVAPFIWLGTGLLTAIAILFYWLIGLHRNLWRYASAANLLAVARWVTITTLVFIPAMFLIDRLDSIARSLLIIQWVIAIVGLWGGRIAYVRCFHPDDLALGRLNAQRTKPALLVGGGDGAALTIQMMAAGAIPGYYAVGLLDNESRIGRSLYSVPILGTLDHFKPVKHGLAAQGIDLRSLVITNSHAGRFEQLRAEASADGLEVENIQDLLLREFSAANSAKSRVKVSDGNEFMAYETLQHGFNIFVGLLIGFLVAPILAISAIAIRIHIGQEIIFSQFRPGQFRRPFLLHKFRTMRPPSDSNGRPLEDRERTPWLGRLLRRSRVDELPQIWNLIKGEMSLIGPRPLLRRDLPKAASQEQLSLRCSVRPGITGWAQVNGGNHLTPQQKLALDLWYIQNRSFMLDLRIMVLTVRMIVFGERINLKAVKQAEDAAGVVVPM